MPGNNAAAGTSPTAPKQTLEGFNYNALPAGSQLLFAQGGSWVNVFIQLQNENARSDNPLVVGSYQPSWGSTARPWLRQRSGLPLIELGAYGGLNIVDGGYVIRNLKLDGGGEDDSLGIRLRFQTRDVVIEDNEISGFGVGVVMGNEGEVGQLRLVIRRNHIHHNIESGLIGAANDMVIERNLFEYNFNSTSSEHGHAIYLAASGRNATIRNNTFNNNSVVGGQCISGNVTAHGVWDGILIENNTITQPAATGRCVGISINAGYAGVAESLRNVVVRGYTLHNLGSAISIATAPGIVIEGNRIFHDQTSWQVGIAVPTERFQESIDAVNGNAVVRNNVVCFATPTTESTPFITSAATTVEGNVYRSRADASTGPCAR